MDKYGRRKMLYISEIPMTTGWLVTAFAKSPSGIIIGRIITGIGTGMGIGAPRVYLAEISRPNMRGALGAFPNLAISIGITVQAVLGSYIKWRVLCYFCAIYSVVLLIFNLFLPETPYFMLTKDSEENAKKSLKRFRGKEWNIEAELADMIAFKKNSGIRRLPFKEQINLMCMKSTLKPFGIIVTYFVIMQMTGVAILIMWTVEILEHSKSSVDAHLGNVLLSVTRGVVGVVTSILLFRVGRRPMALISAFGLGVVCVVLSVYLRYTTKLTVIPQIFYMMYVMFGSLGYYTLPFLIMCEVYPLQIRGLLSGITVSVYNFLIFATNFDFPYVRDGIGFENTILSFGIISLIGFIFLYFALPETKGLTLQEIEQYFKGGKGSRSTKSEKNGEDKSKSGEGTSKMKDESEANTDAVTEKNSSDNPTKSK